MLIVKSFLWAVYCLHGALEIISVMFQCYLYPFCIEQLYTNFLQWKFDLAVPVASVAYFVLLMFAVKTVVRNTEWWDTEFLAEAGMKTNPLNAKMYMTMGNVLAQKVSIM